MFRDEIPTESLIDETVARERNETIGSEGIFDLRADDFRRFLKEYESDNRRNRARAGAVALKKKRQKNAPTKEA